MSVDEFVELKLILFLSEFIVLLLTPLFFISFKFLVLLTFVSSSATKSFNEFKEEDDDDESFWNKCWCCIIFCSITKSEWLVASCLFGSASDLSELFVSEWHDSPFEFDYVFFLLFSLDFNLIWKCKRKRNTNKIKINKVTF